MFPTFFRKQSSQSMFVKVHSENATSDQPTLKLQLQHFIQPLYPCPALFQPAPIACFHMYSRPFFYVTNIQNYVSVHKFLQSSGVQCFRCKMLKGPTFFPGWGTYVCKLHVCFQLQFLLNPIAFERQAIQTALSFVSVLYPYSNI